MNRDIEDPSQIEFRRIQLNTTKGLDYPTYSRFITKECRGNKVIDFGFANHSENVKNIDEESSHETVTQNAKEVLAIDIVEYTGKRFSNVKYIFGNVLGEDIQNLKKIHKINEREYDVFLRAMS